jgi:hypothetical protein
LPRNGAVKPVTKTVEQKERECGHVVFLSDHGTGNDADTEPNDGDGIRPDTGSNHPRRQGLQRSVLKFQQVAIHHRLTRSL